MTAKRPFACGWQVRVTPSSLRIPEAARSRIQTAIDQYREAQKKSGPESEPEQKKKDKQ